MGVVIFVYPITWHTPPIDCMIQYVNGEGVSLLEQPTVKQQLNYSHKTVQTYFISINITSPTVIFLKFTN